MSKDKKPDPGLLADLTRPVPGVPELNGGFPPGQGSPPKAADPAAPPKKKKLTLTDEMRTIARIGNLIAAFDLDGRGRIVSYVMSSIHDQLRARDAAAGMRYAATETDRERD